MNDFVDFLSSVASDELPKIIIAFPVVFIFLFLISKKTKEMTIPKITIISLGVVLFFAFFKYFAYMVIGLLLSGMEG